MRELGHGLQEHDAMRCRSCGNEERASEGTPCESCGTFLCIMCQCKGVKQCAACDGRPLPVGHAPPQSNSRPTAVPSVLSASMSEVARTMPPIPGGDAAPAAPASPPSDPAETLDEDALIDHLFDQLSVDDDRPTP